MVPIGWKVRIASAVRHRLNEKSRGGIARSRSASRRATVGRMQRTWRPNERCSAGSVRAKVEVTFGSAHDEPLAEAHLASAMEPATSASASSIGRRTLVRHSRSPGANTVDLDFAHVPMLLGRHEEAPPSAQRPRRC
jgi:hypothetical protein